VTTVTSADAAAPPPPHRRCFVGAVSGGGGLYTVKVLGASLVDTRFDGNVAARGGKARSAQARMALSPKCACMERVRCLHHTNKCALGGKWDRGEPLMGCIVLHCFFTKFPLCHSACYCARMRTPLSAQALSIKRTAHACAPANASSARTAPPAVRRCSQAFGNNIQLSERM
jgi:hypothetical protein